MIIIACFDIFSCAYALQNWRKFDIDGERKKIKYNEYFIERMERKQTKAAFKTPLEESLMSALTADE